MDENIENRKDLKTPVLEENIEVEETKQNDLKDTLDESICETLKREFIRIYYKLEYVVFPRCSADSSKELKNWDLWGPLFITLLLCIVISFSDNASNSVFVTLFSISFAGSFLVTVNGILLGAKLKYLQTICIMGYCMFPIAISAVLIYSFKAIFTDNHLLNLICGGVAFLWSTTSSIAFFSQIIETKKKFLIIFPLFLYYMILSWFVVTF